MHLEESIEAMFEGDRINTSEDRQVLHTALRIPANENPHNEVKDCLQRMEDNGQSYPFRKVEGI